MTKSSRKRQQRLSIEQRRYRKKEEAVQDSARRAGMCQECQLGLLCLFDSRAAAKSYFMHSLHRKMYIETAHAYVKERMLCKREKP